MSISSISIFINFAAVLQASEFRHRCLLAKEGTMISSTVQALFQSTSLGLQWTEKQYPIVNVIKLLFSQQDSFANLLDASFSPPNLAFIYMAFHKDLAYLQAIDDEKLRRSSEVFGADPEEDAGSVVDSESSNGPWWREGSVSQTSFNEFRKIRLIKKFFKGQSLSQALI
ncbi:hypothetical protein Tco_0973271 [Tanacetum coccineum]